MKARRNQPHPLDATAQRLRLEDSALSGLPLRIAAGHIRITGQPYRCTYEGKPTIFSASPEFCKQVQAEAVAAAEASMAKLRARREQEQRFAEQLEAFDFSKVNLDDVFTS